ncbi:MAG: DUF3333 domain-containing protein, partial [Hyphomicrobium sp.]|nr:DUF3333 domain-containing protein [Hyphomicrobium sp.]
CASSKDTERNMTDSALASPGPLPRRLDLSSDASRARVARRYRAERRFRLYGLAAILFAALFLVILLTDIFIKAMPAFMQSELALDVMVSSELVDPQKIAAGDFDKVIREGLYALFPQMKSRTERRALQDVLSSGAADDLRSMVVANPGLIGQRVQAPVLLSADADLYLKGISTTIVESPGAGEATPSATTGKVTVFSTSNAFTGQLLVVRDLLAKNAEGYTREANRLGEIITSMEADLKAAAGRLDEARKANDVTQATALESQINAMQTNKSRLEGQIKDLRDKSAALMQRHSTAGGSETLTAAMPSVLVAINGGIIKATSLGGDRIEGEVQIPLD